MTSLSYLLYRYTNGSLTIPDGLIRPAENPFYNKIDNGEWTYQHRIINYSYVLSLHIMKSFGVEMIGFSHEYGFDCIPEIKLPIVQRTSSSSWAMDLRVLLPLSLVVFFVGLVVWAWYGWNNNGRQQTKESSKSEKQLTHHHQHDRIQRLLLLLTFFAWLATLFPIAGFLKVGTFVADRLVIASTFGTCIFGGRLIAVLLTTDDRDDSSGDEQHRPALAIRPKTIIKHTILLYLFTNHLAKQTHNRSSEWMDEFSLMTSSLNTNTFDIPQNSHENGILRSSTVPARLKTRTARQAREIAATLLESLNYTGVMAVELFVSSKGGTESLMVNEIAPRVHNSGHWTEAACHVSQFEQHIRAVAGWPLGDTARLTDCVMENLLGDEIFACPDLARLPGAVVHDYGKKQSRDGRKMGHVTRLKVRK